jgi:hypothetical protein
MLRERNIESGLTAVSQLDFGAQISRISTVSRMTTSGTIRSCTAATAIMNKPSIHSATTSISRTLKSAAGSGNGSVASGIDPLTIHPYPVE